MSRVASHRVQGVAALSVVMVLFFIMALVAAYTNRNLVFEQRISANGYRATKALEATDAGVEWTLAMLNGGRINGNCQPVDPNNPAGATDFRRRYLVRATTEQYGEGAFDTVWGQVLANQVYPACIVVGGVPRCVCPTLGQAAANINPPGDGVGSTFRVNFQMFSAGTMYRGGAIQFIVRGCSNPGAGDTACYAQNNGTPGVDATTGAIVTAGLVRALPVAPKAALTAGGTVTVAGGGFLNVANADFASGVTVQAGGDVTDVAALTRFVGPAGSAAATPEKNVAALAALAAPAAQAQELWFRTTFRLDTGSYQRQPAVVRIVCAAGCTRADLDPVVAIHPRNPIWVEGNLDINAAGAIGTAAEPLMLLVNGALTVSADAQITGFVHANSVTWSSAGGSVDGAVMALGDVGITGTATITYNKPVLDTVRLEYGSFVRAPGGWNIF